MQFTSYLQDNSLTVVLTGEIDHHCAKEYIRAIKTKIEVFSPRICILDFENVTFMDSSGIAVIINALRNMTSIQGELYVSGLQSQPLRVFQTAGVDRLVAIKEAIR